MNGPISEYMLIENDLVALGERLPEMPIPGRELNNTRKAYELRHS
jgi:hypothetical protein